MTTYTSQYPTQDADHVKATEYYGTTYYPYFTTNPTLSLTGSHVNNQWLTRLETNMRFHVDLGSAKIIRRIYYENGHHFASNTTGAKNFIFQGSNTASGTFDDLVYTNDGGWTNLTTSQSTFDQHTDNDIVDPKYITVTNTTAYRYYAIKVVDNHGNAEQTGLRRIAMQITEAATAELKVRDEAGNITTLSPHNFKDIPKDVQDINNLESNDMAWTFHSEKDGKSITVDMYSAIRILEKLSGEKLIYMKDADGKDITTYDSSINKLKDIDDKLNDVDIVLESKLDKEVATPVEPKELKVVE